MLSIKVVFLLICLKSTCYGDFTIPKVSLEAYEPAGFRASIPADSDTQLFAFHGKVNEHISRTEPGDFSGDVKIKSEDRFTYYNANLKLKEGDIIHYWYFVQNNFLGYRKDAQNWTVRELRPVPGTGCKASIMKLSDRTSVCKDAIVLEDNFATSLDEAKWTLEQYMPAVPDYEFVFYKKDKDVTFIKNDQLCIKPRLREDTKQLLTMGSIGDELADGCTKPGLCENGTYLIRNPVISGRLESKTSFSYGDFEVKARVPSGDWIFPEIYLEDPQRRRILIAYTRGNKHLTGDAGDDLGNSLLFGGPVRQHNEPARSINLKSYAHNAPLSESSHTYRLRWTSNLIELFFDGNRYGEVGTEPGFTGSNPGKFKLVLGVGVGGVNDFPDDYKSGENVKPWRNFKRTQVRDFFSASSTWHPTWDNERKQLQVDYVKITAV
ncbi:beta-1,3-glucan-binding protein 1 [Anoplophora glabripennis]|nr:beta-1,3-glucan-binding protein 1 [Anoplophora glabripennis]